MPCIYCQQYCGDKTFCGSDCYEQYEDDLADLMAKSECDALLNDEPAPFNESFGTKGNE